MKIIVIKNWDEYQHYKDRTAPWIKLQRDMLTSESWVLGTDLSRVVQLASMMLAPRYNNSTPYRFDLLKRVMSLDCTEAAFDKAIDYLITANFIEIRELPTEERSLEQNASKPLASCSSEENRGEEKRREKKGASAPPFDPSTVNGLDLEAWELWLEHRTAIKKPIRPHSLADAAEELAKLGDRQLAEVKRARAGGWQGLHPEESKIARFPAPAQPSAARPFPQ